MTPPAQAQWGGDGRAITCGAGLAVYKCSRALPAMIGKLQCMRGEGGANYSCRSIKMLTVGNEYYAVQRVGIVTALCNLHMVRDCVCEFTQRSPSPYPPFVLQYQ